MHVSMQSYVFSTQPFHFSHRPAREIAPLVNLNPENPIDTNRLTTFSITEMNVTKVGNFESIISQYQIVMDLLVIETSIPSIELEQQYQVSLRSLDNKTSDRKKSNPADRADSFPDYMSYTGSRWTYVSFGCTFDLGVLMQFQSLTADIFAVDLVHSYHQRVAKDEVGLRSSARLRQPVVTDEALGEKDNNDQAAFLTYYNVGEHAYYEVLNVINSPFVSTSSLRTRWTGDSSDCKMGDVFVHASAGGNLKGLESFQMIKSTVDRINGRMTYMKTKAAALYRDPISEQMNSIRYKKKRRTRTRSGETVGSDSLPNNKQGPHRKNAGRSSFSKAFEDVPDVNVGAKMSNASLQEQLGALGAPVTSVTMTNLQVEFCVETPQIIGITAKKSRRRHAGVERNIDFRRKSSILLTGKNNGKPSDVPSGSLWDENVPIAKKEEPIEFHEFNNTRNELDGFAKMTLISRGFVYSSSIHGSVFNIADCSMYLNDYRDMPWLHLSGFRFSSIVQANKKTNGKSNKEKDTYPFNLSPSEKTSEYQKNETIGVPIKEIIVDMNEFVVSFAPEMNSGHFIDLMSAQLSAYGVATLPISPPAHPSDEPFSPTNDNFQESTFEVGADNASDSQNTDIERDDEDLDSTVRIGLHLGKIYLVVGRLMVLFLQLRLILF